MADVQVTGKGNIDFFRTYVNHLFGNGANVIVLNEKYAVFEEGLFHIPSCPEYGFLKTKSGGIKKIGEIIKDDTPWVIECGIESGSRIEEYARVAAKCTCLSDK